jgi:mercuric reductase
MSRRQHGGPPKKAAPGIIKMVADAETNEFLGVSMVGHNADEVIHETATQSVNHA